MKGPFPMPLDFGTPVPVDDLPVASGKGGRQSNAPAIEAWLSQVPADGKPYELASSDPDGAHPASRVAQIRKVADGSNRPFKVDTRSVVVGKRYRIFASLAPEEAPAP